jgi:oligoribonuclease
MSKEDEEQFIFWVDIETSGLDENKHQMLEIACILTDDVLREVGQMQRVVLPYYPAAFEENPDLTRGDVIDLAYHEADEFVQNMHTENGLWSALAGEAVPRETVEAEVLAWLTTTLEEHGIETKPIVGGASVDFDKRFIAKQMPTLAAALHYRIMDVSVLKRMGEWWLPEYYEELPRMEVHIEHRAMGDISHTLHEATEIRRMVRNHAKLAFDGG